MSKSLPETTLSFSGIKYIDISAFIPTISKRTTPTGRSLTQPINKILPEEKFCKKCGSSEYYIETKEKIEFFDYEYAIILKEEVNTKVKIKKTLQIWIEEENVRQVLRKPKLLTVF